MLFAMSPYRALLAQAASTPQQPPWVVAAASLGWIVAVSLRPLLTTQVPPAWLKVPAPLRPILALLVGGLIAFFAALKAGEAWQTAATGAIVSMAAAAPKVLADEKSGPQDPPSTGATGAGPTPAPITLRSVPKPA